MRNCFCSRWSGWQGIRSREWKSPPPPRCGQREFDEYTGHLAPLDACWKCGMGVSPMCYFLGNHGQNARATGIFNTRLETAPTTKCLLTQTKVVWSQRLAESYDRVYSDETGTQRTRPPTSGSAPAQVALSAVRHIDFAIGEKPRRDKEPNPADQPPSGLSSLRDCRCDRPSNSPLKRWAIFNRSCRDEGQLATEVQRAIAKSVLHSANVADRSVDQNANQGAGFPPRAGGSD